MCTRQSMCRSSRYEPRLCILLCSRPLRMSCWTTYRATPACGQWIRAVICSLRARSRGIRFRLRPWLRMRMRPRPGLPYRWGWSISTISRRARMWTRHSVHIGISIRARCLRMCRMSCAARYPRSWWTWYSMLLSVTGRRDYGWAFEPYIVGAFRWECAAGSPGCGGCDEEAWFLLSSGCSCLASWCREHGCRIAAEAYRADSHELSGSQDGFHAHGCRLRGVGAFLSRMPRGGEHEWRDIEVSWDIRPLWPSWGGSARTPDIQSRARLFVDARPRGGERPAHCGWRRHGG